jgi:hypothetical protein
MYSQVFLWPLAPLDLEGFWQGSRAITGPIGRMSLTACCFRQQPAHIRRRASFDAMQLSSFPTTPRMDAAAMQDRAVDHHATPFPLLRNLSLGWRVKLICIELSAYRLMALICPFPHACQSCCRSAVLVPPNYLAICRPPSQQQHMRGTPRAAAMSKPGSGCQHPLLGADGPGDSAWAALCAVAAGGNSIGPVCLSCITHQPESSPQRPLPPQLGVCQIRTGMQATWCVTGRPDRRSNRPQNRPELP